MNILEIFVLITIVFCTFMGYRSGLIRVIFSLFSWALALGLGSLAAPHVAVFLEQNTGVKSIIQEMCVGYISRLAQNETADSTIAVFGEFLEGTGIYEGIAAEIAGYILKGVSFFLVMIAVGILMNLLWYILDLASHLPVIEGANKTLGAAVGLLKGLVIVWGLFGIIQLCSVTAAGGILLEWIEESFWLKELYEYNFLFRIIMRLIAAI